MLAIEQQLIKPPKLSGISRNHTVAVNPRRTINDGAAKKIPTLTQQSSLYQESSKTPKFSKARMLGRT